MTTTSTHVPDPTASNAWISNDSVPKYRKHYVDELAGDYEARLVDLKFQRATELINALPQTNAVAPAGTVIQLHNDEKLLFYGLYKQATEGDVKVPRPAFYDYVARAKWDAWNSRKGSSESQAKAAYVEAFVSFLHRYSDNVHAVTCLQSLSEVEQRMEDYDSDGEELGEGLPLHTPLSMATDNETFLSTEEFTAALMARERAEAAEHASNISEISARPSAGSAIAAPYSQPSSSGVGSHQPYVLYPGTSSNSLTSANPFPFAAGSGTAPPKSASSQHQPDTFQTPLNSLGPPHSSIENRFAPPVASSPLGPSNVSAYPPSSRDTLLQQSATLGSAKHPPTAVRLSSEELKLQQTGQASPHGTTPLSGDAETALQVLQTEVAALNERIEIMRREYNDRERQRSTSKRGLWWLVKLCVRHAVINCALFFILFAYLYYRRSPLATDLLAFIAPKLARTYDRGRRVVDRGRGVVDKGRGVVASAAEKLQAKISHH